jgi:hypothetical protein
MFSWVFDEELFELVDGLNNKPDTIQNLCVQDSKFDHQVIRCATSNAHPKQTLIKILTPFGTGGWQVGFRFVVVCPLFAATAAAIPSESRS